MLLLFIIMENNFTIIDNDCYLIDYNYCYNIDNTYYAFYLNFISDFLYILYLFSLPFITFSFGLFLSFIFVSQFIYKPLVNDFIKLYNNNPDLYTYDPFLLEYIDEFSNLSSEPLSKDTLKKLQNSFIKIYTKFGNILMYYDYDNTSFNYYAKKNNTFTFDYLDAVARIYVVKYNCKNLYYDNFENLYFKNNNDNHNDNDDDNNDNKKTSVFYKSKLFKNKKSNIQFKSNKYKYKGTIEFFYKKCKYYNYSIKINTNLDFSNNIITYTDISNNNLLLSNDISCNDISCNDISCNDISCNDISCNDISCNDISYNDISCNDISCNDISCNDNYMFFLNTNKNLLYQNDISDISIFDKDDFQDVSFNHKNISYSDFIKKNK